VGSDSKAKVSVLDPQSLGELRAMRDGGSPEIVEELLQAFEADSRPLLINLREAAQAEDASALRAAAHGLKGAAANLGGRAMAAVCQEIEKQARQGAISDDILLTQVEKAFEQLCVALQAEARGANE
jgi:HPt (histidine-containing phosphotransfer) domain-containing protein